MTGVAETAVPNVNGSIRGGKGKVGRAHAFEEVNALVISGGG